MPAEIPGLNGFGILLLAALLALAATFTLRRQAVRRTELN